MSKNNKAEHAVKSYAAGTGSQGAHAMNMVTAQDIHCLRKATESIGLNDGRRRRRRKIAVLRAAAA